EMNASAATRPEVQSAARYEALFRVSQAIRTHRDPTELLCILAGELRVVVNFNWLAVGRSDEGNHQWRLDVLEATGAQVQLPQFAPEETLTWWVHQHQQPLVVPFVDKETRFPRLTEFLKSQGTHSICGLPLTTPQRRLGALSLGCEKPDAYSVE